MLVSVCIPTYSRLEYLRLAVDSAFAQTMDDFEVCVALDPMPGGPNREIQEWCVSYAAGEPRFRYQVNEKNAGLAGNWNVLAGMAKGEYVIIIGDDDTLEPQYLEKLTANVAATQADVVFCDQNFIDATGSVLPQMSDDMSVKYHRRGLPEGVLPNPVEVVLNNTVPMSASIIKRKHVLAFPFDPSLNTPELEVFLKIAAQGGIFEYVGARLANYRVHLESATSGGLKLHYLLRNIIPVEVPAEYEHLKHKLISDRMIPAVNICLREGDKVLAGMLLDSKYYPAGKAHLKLIQRILLSGPSFLTRRLL